MSDIRSAFKRYIEEFIEILTTNQEEFFISLCDIEEELIEGLDTSAFRNYSVIVINKNDYSEAVRARNDVAVKKIVLLSGEGVKHIDSLKDFNEYSVMSEKRQLILKCLEEAFDIKIRESIGVFLENIIEFGEISLKELLEYLGCSINNREIFPEQLNSNLPMLGIWKSSKDTLPGKNKIKKMIRLSRYATLEAKLQKAIADGKVEADSANIIVRSLAQGDAQEILEKISYEKAEEWLKNSARGIPGTDLDHENLVPELWSSFSYEYKLQGCTEDSVEDIEREWLQERQNDNSDIDWDHYKPLVDDINIYNAEIENIIAEIERLLLPDKEKRILLDKVRIFWQDFREAWADVIFVTPLCLNMFCKNAKTYTKDYLELLATIMTEPRLRAIVSGIELIDKLQMLFCVKEQHKIRMPYYHPLCVFYYLDIRKMYALILDKSEKSDIGILKDTVQLALLQKIGLQFPVNMMCTSGDGRAQYAIDRTTVWQSSVVEFDDIETGIIYSVLDFRVIRNQIIEYLTKHPFLTEITIALIDINTLDGMEQLAETVHKLANGNQCNIGRIDFLIISSKEEELKKKLSQIWETFEMKDLIRFRFGRKMYRRKSGQGYELERIVEEADMIIIADSAVMYQKPRKKRINWNANMISNRLEVFDMEEQLQNYIATGYSDISILWATLQQAAESREEGLWRWESREPDNEFLTFCNSCVELSPEKTIVTLSSNKDILSQIFMRTNMHAFRRNYNGKRITIINLDQDNKERRLPIKGEAKISYSLNSFYETELDLKEMVGQIFPGAMDVLLDFRCGKKGTECSCSICAEESWERNEEAVKICEALLSWQLDDFLKQNNIFSDYFGELLLNQWYEKADTLPAVLMLERLRKGGKIRFEFTGEKRKGDDWINLDSLEAIKVHEMIQFSINKNVIDEKMISEFLKFYEPEMLNKILKCDSQYALLQKEVRDRLEHIQKWIKGDGDGGT